MAIQFKPIKKNYNIIINNGHQILYSYSTPVAVIPSEGSILRTKQKYTTTTSRHINKFLEGLDSHEVDQKIISSYAD